MKLTYLKQWMTLTTILVSSLFSHISAQDTFYLVTDASQLQEGDKIIIGYLGNVNSSYALKTYNGDPNIWTMIQPGSNDKVISTKNIIYNDHSITELPENTLVFDLVRNNESWSLKTNITNSETSTIEERFLKITSVPSLELATYNEDEITIVTNGETTTISSGKSYIVAGTKTNTSKNIVFSSYDKKSSYNSTKSFQIYANRKPSIPQNFAQFIYNGDNRITTTDKFIDPITCSIKQGESSSIPQYRDYNDYIILFPNNLINIKCNSDHELKYIEIYYSPTAGLSERQLVLVNDEELGILSGSHGIWTSNGESVSEINILVQESAQITQINVYYESVGGEDEPLLPALNVKTNFLADEHILYLNASDELANATIYYAIKPATDPQPEELTDKYLSPILMRYHAFDGITSYKLWTSIQAPGYETSPITVSGEFYIGSGYLNNSIKYQRIKTEEQVIPNYWYLITAIHEGSLYALGAKNQDGNYDAFKLCSHVDEILAWSDTFDKLGIKEFKLAGDYFTDKILGEELKPGNTASPLSYQLLANDDTTNGSPTQFTVNLVNDTHSLSVDGQSLGFDPENMTFGFGKSSPIALYTTNSSQNTSITNVTLDNEASTSIYYNLQGLKVDNPTPGIYIEVKGTTATKTIIR